MVTKLLFNNIFCEIIYKTKGIKIVINSNKNKLERFGEMKKKW